MRYAEMAPKDRRLFHIGSLLYLTDLQEVSSQTGDRVKYVVSHEVQGRVKLLRLLNPSALFETDSEGNKVNYLKAVSYCTFPSQMAKTHCFGLSVLA